MSDLLLPQNVVNKQSFQKNRISSQFYLKIKPFYKELKLTVPSGACARPPAVCSLRSQLLKLVNPFSVEYFYLDSILQISDQILVDVKVIEIRDVFSIFNVREKLQTKEGPESIITRTGR